MVSPIYDPVAGCADELLNIDEELLDADLDIAEMAKALEGLKTPEADLPACPASPMVVAPVVPMSLARRAVTMRRTGVPDHPLKNISDMELSMRVKYGVEHLNVHAGVDQFYSVHDNFAAGCFRSLSKTLRASMHVSGALLDELNSFGDSGAAAAACAIQALADCSAPSVIEDDMGAGSFDASNAGRTEEGNLDVRHLFFKIVQKYPKRIRGQSGDVAPNFAPGEIIVDMLPALAVNMSGLGAGVYIWAEHNSKTKDVSLMGSSDFMMARMAHWTLDPEKYFWSPILDTPREGFNDVLAAVRTLHDLGALPQSVVYYNIPSDDAANLALFERFAALGVFSCKSIGPPSSWQLSSQFMLTMQPVTRLIKPAYVIAEHRIDIPIASMSILDLVNQLQHDGWKLEQWDRKEDPPPPVVVATCRPKRFYMSLSSEGLPVASKHYLVCLNV